MVLLVDLKNVLEVILILLIFKARFCRESDGIYISPPLFSLILMRFVLYNYAGNNSMLFEGVCIHLRTLFCSKSFEDRWSLNVKGLSDCVCVCAFEFTACTQSWCYSALKTNFSGVCLVIVAHNIKHKGFLNIYILYQSKQHTHTHSQPASHCSVNSMGWRMCGLME